MDLRHFKSIACGIAIAAAIAIPSRYALAQSDIGESTVPPSPPAVHAEPPADQDLRAAQPIPAAHPVVAARPAPAVAERPASGTQHPAAMIPYTIRPGDSIGSIAEMFGISADQLAKVNRLNPDEELMAGAVLRVPHPFATQVETLEAQAAALSAQLQAANQKAGSADDRIKSLQDQVQELGGDKESLQASLKLLPWWRATAMGVGAAALFMFAVMAITLFEWWRMRRRFIVLAQLTDTLGHLDYKYKAMLAKAELRLQQLYGRRRQGIAEGQSRSKMPEEIEIERLNEELKEVLETHLQRLGVRNRGSHRRKGWKEVLDSGDAGQPAEANSVRR
jgi:LysM repeat protein